MPVPGRRVDHPLHGEGTVLALRGDDRFFVAFDRAPDLPRTVTEAELLLSGEAGVSTNYAGAGLREDGAGAGTLPRSSGLERAELRQAVEALRLGVVPAAHVLDYTVGREREIGSLMELLRDGQGLRVVWGDYGAGKTHLLDVLEQAAHGLGFVTARLVLDPLRIPPSHPQRLYGEIVRRLRYPKSAGHGLEPLLARLDPLRSLRESSHPSFSRFLSPLLFARGAGDQEALGYASDYAEGWPMDAADVNRSLRRAGWRGPGVLAMSDFRTYGRMYAHLVGTLAAWARVAGWQGLLLLVDEVEYVDSLNAETRHLADEVLKHWAAATMPREALGFDPGALYKGGHEIHRSLPIRFAEDQPLGVVMAFTPLGELERFGREIVRPESHHLRLETLGEADFADLVAKVGDLYARAHPPYRPSPAILAALRREILRDAARGLASPRDSVRRLVLGFDVERCGAATAAKAAGS